MLSRSAFSRSVEAAVPRAIRAPAEVSYGESRLDLRDFRTRLRLAERHGGHLGHDEHRSPRLLQDAPGTLPSNELAIAPFRREPTTITSASVESA